MCLVALQDQGLTVFPTHRLVRDTTPADPGGAGEHAARAVRPSRRSTRSTCAGRTATARYDRLHRPHFKRRFRLTLKDQATADPRWPTCPGLPPARHRRARGARAQGAARPDRGRHLPPEGLGYCRTDDEALRSCSSGEFDAAFFLRPTPSSRSAGVAAAGREHAARSRRTSSPRSPPDCSSIRCYDESRRINGMKATATRDAATGTSCGCAVTPEHRRAEDTGGERQRPEPTGAPGRLPRLVHRGHDGDVRDAQGLGHRRRRGRLRVHAGRARLPDRFEIVAAPARHASATSRSSACG